MGRIALEGHRPRLDCAATPPLIHAPVFAGAPRRVGRACRSSRAARNVAPSKRLTGPRIVTAARFGHKVLRRHGKFLVAVWWRSSEVSSLAQSRKVDRKSVV